MKRTERPEYFTTNKNQVKVEFLKPSIYVKTKDGQIFDISNISKQKGLVTTFHGQKILREADNIEELCDGFILVDKSASRGCKGISYRFFNWINKQGGFVIFMDGKKFRKCCFSLRQLNDEPFTVYGYTSREDDIGGIMLVAKLTKKGEFELL